MFTPLCYPRPTLATPRCWAFRSLFNKLAFVTIAAVGLTLPARSASAYFLEGPSWASGTQITFQMALGTAPGILTDGNVSWNIAAIPAFSVWNQFLVRVQFLNVINPSAPVSTGDGINSIVFANKVFGQSFGSGTLAVTYYRYSGSRMSEADILFNNAQTWDSYRGPLRFDSNWRAIGDIRRVLTHELGHALGLAHPDQHGQNIDAIMNSLVSDRETASADDVTGAQAIYGAAIPVVPKISSATHLLSGHVFLQGSGGPNILYTLQFTPRLDTPFTPLVSVTADAAGVFQFEDAAATGTMSGFYRLSSP